MTQLFSTDAHTAYTSQQVPIQRYAMTRSHSFAFWALASLGTLNSLHVQAEEIGKVISSTPIIQQVAVPRQVCTNEQVVTPAQKSGAGAAMGAIAGGAVGNSIGQGSGRAAATMLGIFGGAILGDKIEGPGQNEVRNVQNCSQQMFYENRTMAYNVVYEFAGKQYTVQMPTDPGPTVRLQVTPVPPPPVPMNAGVPPLGSAPRY